MKPLHRIAALVAALAVLAGLVVTTRRRPSTAVKVPEGTGAYCAGESATCASDTSIERCVNGRLQTFPCTGPGGCKRDQALGVGKVVRCDLSGSQEGDRCFSAQDQPREGSCTADRKEMVSCRDGKIERKPCRGRHGCSTSMFVGNDVWCDTTVAAVDDRCAPEGDPACSVERDTRLVCRGGTFVVDVPCNGPKKCEVKRADGQLDVPRFSPPKAGDDLIACDPGSGATAPAEAPSAEESAIYAVLLARAQRNKGKSVVVERACSRDWVDRDRAARVALLKSSMPGVSDETIDGLFAAASKPCRLADFTAPPLKVLLIEAAELEGFFGVGGSGGGSSFEKAYPDTIGLAKLSRVGFNAARTQALVYFQISRGGGEGSGDFVLLTKTAAGWSPIEWNHVVSY